jgi:hypothetical protein
MNRIDGCSARRRDAAGTARHVMALLLIAAARLPAQQSTATPAGGWIIGGSVGMFGVGTETVPLELFTLGMHWTQVRPGHLGADISIGTVPRVLAEGVVVGAARLGVTYPVTVAPGLLLLPTAGLSLIGGVGQGGAGGARGYNLGGAMVLGTGPLGVRAGATWHRIDQSSSTIWLAEVGLVGRPPGIR